MMVNTEDIAFVLLPASSSVPPKELVWKQEASLNISGNGDPFWYLLEPYFQLQDGKSVDMALIEKEAIAAKESGCSTHACLHVSLATLQRSAEEGTLEKIRIGEDDDSDTSIYMYYDDSAQYKRRPINHRAIRHAQKKEREEGSYIYGDVFLAQLQKDDQPVSLDVEAIQQHRAPWRKSKRAANK